jgi:SOS response regulatory protein OraA/RecX
MAVKKLAGADCSRREMAVWLLKRGCAAPDVPLIIDKLLSYNYLNDERLCAALCERWLADGAGGKTLLWHKLSRRGLDSELIGARINSLDIDENALALSALKRYLPKLKERDTKNLAKLYRYLSARGFSPEAVKKAVAAALKGVGKEDGGA